MIKEVPIANARVQFQGPATSALPSPPDGLVWLWLRETPL